MITIYDLKTNGMKNLLGTDKISPVFSWKLSSDETDVRQESYQIQVATDLNFKELVWDSGQVRSDKSVGIKYEGSALEASTRYY